MQRIINTTKTVVYNADGSVTKTTSITYMPVAETPTTTADPSVKVQYRPDKNALINFMRHYAVGKDVLELPAHEVFDAFEVWCKDNKVLSNLTANNFIKVVMKNFGDYAISLGRKRVKGAQYSFVRYDFPAIRQYFTNTDN
jgi:hypothetical protein